MSLVEEVRDTLILLLELFMLSNCVEPLPISCFGLPLHPIPLAMGSEEGFDWM